MEGWRSKGKKRERDKSTVREKEGKRED